MSDLKIDGQVIKSEFFHSNELGWYAMLQIQLRGEDFFIAQQLPQKVTCGWERWIPVTERLPENGEIVLVCGERGGIYTAYCNSAYKNPGWHKMNSKNHYCNPTHWMPLPEPPKE